MGLDMFQVDDSYDYQSLSILSKDHQNPFVVSVSGASFVNRPYILSLI